MLVSLNMFAVTQVRYFYNLLIEALCVCSDRLKLLLFDCEEVVRSRDDFSLSSKMTPKFRA